MLPDGAKPLVSKGGEAIAVKFEQEGVYGVKCLPHYGICMVVMVGASADVDRAKAVSQVGKAKQAAGKWRPSESVGIKPSANDAAICAPTKSRRSRRPTMSVTELGRRPWQPCRN